MGSEREKLEEQLGEYILDTLKYTETVKEFCDREPRWSSQRKTELDMMRDIKDRADQIVLKFDHVTKAENKTKALGEYMWNGVTRGAAESRKQELEKELGKVLKSTLEGLEKLQHFLDAVEKLAVTSLFVFMGESFMPNGVSSMSLRSVISAARMVSPLLIHFKRDAESFFLPSLSNVAVLAFQLDKYIRVTQQIFEKMKKGCESIPDSGGVCKWKKGISSLKCNSNMSEETVEDLYDHLLQLTKIRMDELFRMTFLFGEKAQDFIDVFSEPHCRMFQFLSDLENAAFQLDKMKFGSNISTVAGSSVGIAGGVCSIVGLALAPVTAGASLVLTLTGVGLGVTSGTNSLVTGVTEMAVNRHHGKIANTTFISFMEDVEKILNCMEEVASREGITDDAGVLNMVIEFGKLAARGVGIVKGIDAIVDAASAVKILGSEETFATATNLVVQEAKAGRNIPDLAADLPDIGQLAKGTPVALSKSARVGFISLNALFIGVDVLFIYKDSISLAKGSKNEVAELIRSRSALWRSEVEAWEKIHNQLFEGISEFSKKKEILDQHFQF